EAGTVAAKHTKAGTATIEAARRKVRSGPPCCAVRGRQCRPPPPSWIVHRHLAPLAPSSQSLSFSSSLVSDAMGYTCKAQSGDPVRAAAMFVVVANEFRASRVPCSSARRPDEAEPRVRLQSCSLPTGCQGLDEAP